MIDTTDLGARKRYGSRTGAVGWTMGERPIQVEGPEGRAPCAAAASAARDAEATSPKSSASTDGSRGSPAPCPAPWLERLRDHNRATDEARRQLDEARLVVTLVARRLHGALALRHGPTRTELVNDLRADLGKQLAREEEASTRWNALVDNPPLLEARS